MATTNSFDARATLSVGDRSYEIYRLDALQSKYDVARLPFSLKILLENLLRNEDGESIRAQDIEALATWNANDEPLQGDRLHPRARRHAGLHRRPGDRRPGRDARRDARPRRRPEQDQPARPGRAGDRPLGPGRRLRHRRRVPAQRRPGVRAQPGALRVPALGPGRVSTTSASSRRTPGSSIRSTSSTWRASCSSTTEQQPRLSRHARRDRLAHDDDQRPGRARLGRRRDRGRGGDARPADVDADPAGARLQARPASCPRARPPPTSC